MSDKYAIHSAVRENKPLTVENLLMENPKVFLLQDEDERTPLHWACSVNNEKMVDLLMKYAKFEYDIDDLVDASGWTPVHIASAIGNSTILNRLLQHEPAPDVNLATNQGTTALHLAVSKNHADTVRELVNVYKCSCRVKDKKGLTPLHRAACIGNQPLIKLLVEQGKSNVNARDTDGWTSLHHALAEGHGDVGVLLVSLGADVNVEDNDGRKPVDVAVDASVATYFKKNIA